MVRGRTGWEPLGALVLGTLAGLALGAAGGGLLLLPLVGEGPLLLGVAAALVVPTLFAEPTPGLIRERVLYEIDGAVSAIRVVEIIYPGERQPERRMYVNDEEESGELVRSGAPTLPYIAAAEQWLAQAIPRGARYLLLGGGAYTLPRRIAERDPRARITTVELDPEVTRTATRFFGLRPEHGISSLHGDARAAIEYFAARSGAEERGEQRFDAIVVDVYGGDESLPHALVTREAFALFQRLLAGNGWLLLNTIGVTVGNGSRRFWSIVRTASEHFPNLALYPHLAREYPERQNVLLAASPSAAVVPPERAGLFERWPRAEWPEWGGTRILRDLFDSPSGAAEPRGERQSEGAASAS